MQIGGRGTPLDGKYATYAAHPCCCLADLSRDGTHLSGWQTPWKSRKLSKRRWIWRRISWAGRRWCWRWGWSWWGQSSPQASPSLASPLDSAWLEVYTRALPPQSDPRILPLSIFQPKGLTLQDVRVCNCTENVIFSNSLKLPFIFQLASHKFWCRSEFWQLGHF